MSLKNVSYQQKEERNWAPNFMIFKMINFCRSTSDCILNVLLISVKNLTFL